MLLNSSSEGSGISNFQNTRVPEIWEICAIAPSACAPEIYYYAEALEMKATQADSTAVVGMEVEDSESSKVDSVCRVVIPGKATITKIFLSCYVLELLEIYVGDSNEIYIKNS